MSAAIIEVADLDVYYGTSQILFGVGLSVRQGETMALLGRNGAGKSTAMKAIMGLVPPAEGEVSFADVRIERLPPYRIARLGLGYVPEERRIFTDLAAFPSRPLCVLRSFAVGFRVNSWGVNLRSPISSLLR